MDLGDMTLAITFKKQAAQVFPSSTVDETVSFHENLKRRRVPFQKTLQAITHSPGDNKKQLKLQDGLMDSALPAVRGWTLHS